jgi:hypothetical protein
LTYSFRLTREVYRGDMAVWTITRPEGSLGISGFSICLKFFVFCFSAIRRAKVVRSRMGKLNH